MQIATTTCRVLHFTETEAASNTSQLLEWLPESQVFVDIATVTNSADNWEHTGFITLSEECSTVVNDYIAILYTPIFLILIGLIILITLKIFEFRNPWKA